MKSFFRKVAPFLFALWTFGVMATYFYFYQTYGQFYLNAFVLVLFLAAFFIPLLFSISLPYLFRGKQPPFVLWFRRLPNTVFVPVRSLVIVFYGCTASWILLIFLLKPDIGISINSVVSVFLVTIITLSGFSVGSRLVRRFHIATDSLLERFVLSTLLGFGVLMLIVYIAGMVGLLYGTAAYALVLSLLFVFRKEWLTLFSDIKATSLPWHIKPFFTFDNFAIIASFILFVFATTGLLSQFAAGWDEMHTYQAFPHAYAEAHRIVDFKYWFASGFPQNTEMLFTLAHLLKGFTPAAGLNTIFYFLLPGILVLIKRVVFPKASSPVIVLLYALSAIPYLMITVDHKIDLAFWCYTLLATLYLLKFFQTPERKTFLLFAILAGIASGTKYNFFSIILPSFLAVLLFFPKEFNLKKRLVHITLLLSIIAVCFSPWAVKNIIFSGNPVEPALGDILSRNDTFFKQIGRSYSEHLKEHLSDTNIWVENQEIRGWEFYLSIPFRLTFNYKGKNFEDMINIGPIFLIVAPLFAYSFLKRKRVGIRDSRATILSIIGIQSVLWLLLGNFVIWYGFFTLSLMLILVGSTFNASQNRFIKISFASAIMSLSASTALTRLDATFRNSTLFVHEDTGDYYLYDVANYINANNLNGLIWSHGASLNYYVRNSNSRIIYDYWLHIFHFLREEYGDSLPEKLQSLNIRYFVFNEEDLMYRIRLAELYKGASPHSAYLFMQSQVDYMNFRSKYLEEIFRSGKIAVYKFRAHTVK